MTKGKFSLTVQDLLVRGYLIAGEELTCIPSKGSNVHTASVDSQGNIRSGDDVYPTPSAWAEALAGSSRNGWTYVRRKRDDKTLRSIQREAIQRDHESSRVESGGTREESPVPPEPVSDSDIALEHSKMERGVDAARLLERVMQLSPTIFEKLVGEFLRAKGFENVEVTQRSHDGGIDGHCHLSFLKFGVAFQAKRWSQQNVPVEHLQRLVGSIRGRFERGVFVTTSDYSPAARKWMEETNPPIVALNGEEFAQQLLDHELGIVRIPLVERRIDEGFFEALGG